MAPLAPTRQVGIQLLALTDILAAVVADTLSALVSFWLALLGSDGLSCKSSVLVSTVLVRLDIVTTTLPSWLTMVTSSGGEEN